MMKQILHSSKVCRMSGFFGFLLHSLLFLLHGTALAVPDNESKVVWHYTANDSGQQEASAVTMDSAGNIIVVGYSDKSGSKDFHLLKIADNGNDSTLLLNDSIDLTSGDDWALAVAVDHMQHIIVAGYGYNGPVRKKDIWVVKYCGETNLPRPGIPGGDPLACNQGDILWQALYNGPANGDDYPAAIAVDTDNNVYVGGYQQNYNGDYDYLLMKYYSTGPNPDGSSAWRRTKNGTGGENDYLRDIAVARINGQNYIAVSGDSAGTNSGADIYTIKYDANGDVVWDRRVTTDDNGTDGAVKVAFDHQGNVVVGGYIYTAGSSNDIFIRKYTATGNTAWTIIWADGMDDQLTDLYVDQRNDVYVTGKTYTLTDNYNVFTARYDSVNANDSPEAWETIYNFTGSANKEEGVAILVDDSSEAGAVYVAANSESGGDYDFLTLKYHRSNGSILFTETYDGNGGSRPDMTVGLGLTPGRELLVGGWTDSYTNSSQDYNFHVVKYATAVLDPPTNVTAEATALDTIRLTWIDNTETEDGFEIYRSLAPGITTDAYLVATVSANATAHNDSSLAANTRYYYNVRAFNNDSNDFTYSSLATKEATAVTTVLYYPKPDWWLFTYDGVDHLDDMAVGIAVGPDNHPVITGYVNSFSNDFDYYTIKLNRVPLTNDSINTEWIDFSDYSDGLTDKACGVAVHANNEVVITGYYMRITNDILSMKYPATGLWHGDGGHVDQPDWISAHDGGFGTDKPDSIVTGPDGYTVAIAGHGINSSGNEDIYLIKLNAAGTKVSPVQTYDSGADDEPNQVIFDSAGDMILTGKCNGTGGTNYDICTRKYRGNDSTLLWMQQKGEAGRDDVGNALTVDDNDNVYVTGYITNNDSNKDYYTVKYGKDGTLKWQKTYPGPAGGEDYGVAIAYDRLADTIAVGGTRLTSSGNHDFLVIRYDSADGSVDANSEILLDREFDDDHLKLMGMDMSGNLCMVGTTGAAGHEDIIGACYDYAGQILGSMKYIGAGNSVDMPAAMVVNSLGEMFVAGYSVNGDDNYDYIAFKTLEDAMQPLQAPYPFSAIAYYQSADLTWTDNTYNESGFEINRFAGACPDNPNWPDIDPESIAIFNVDNDTTTYTTSGLSSKNASYCLRVRAQRNGLHFSQWLQTEIITSEAPPPTNLVASPVSANQIELTWTLNTTGENYVKVFKRSGNDSYTEIASLPGLSVAFTDPEVCEGESYDYFVRAGNNDSNTWSTNDSIADTGNATLLKTDPLLTAVRSSDAQIDVIWSDTNANESGFHLEKCLGNDTCVDFSPLADLVETDFGGNILSLSFEENSYSGVADEVKDSSGLGYHGIAGGNVFTKDEVISGKAAVFDGTDDYINLGDIDLLDNPDTVTISLWFNRAVDQTAVTATNHGTNNVLIAQSSDLKNDNIEIGSTGSSIEMYLDTTGYDVSARTFEAGIIDNTWYHLVFTYDSSAPYEVKLFLNGELLVQENDWGGNIDSSSSSALSLGIARIDGSLWGDFKGMIDEVRIFDQALSPTAVKNLYSGYTGDTPLDQVNFHKPSLYLKFNETKWVGGSTYDVADSSGNGNNGVFKNSLLPMDGFLANGLYSDNNDSYVEIPATNSLIDLMDSSYTFMAWVRPFSIPPNVSMQDAYGIILRPGSHSGLYYHRNQYFYFTQWKSDGTSISRSSAVPLAPGAWHHVVGVTDDASKTIALYIDGVSQGTPVSYAGSTLKDYGSVAYRIGAGNTPGTNYAWILDGIIDEALIYNHALSAVEVKAVYDSYANQYPFAHPDSVMFLTMDENSWAGDAGEVQDKSRSGNHGTGRGGVDTAEVDIKNRAGLFDGVDDYIEVTASTTFGNVTDSSFTFAAWANPASFPANTSSNNSHYTLIARRGYHLALLYGNDGKFEFDIWANTTPDSFWIESSATFQPNEWHHVAGVADDVNKKISLYVDGVLQASASYTGNLRDYGLESYRIGQSYTDYVKRYFHGMIDDAAVYNKALSAAEIQKIYAMYWPPAMQDPVAESIVYLEMNEGTWNGTTGEVKDKSAYANHGTAINGATVVNDSIFDNGGYFDGVDDCIEILPTTSLNTLTDTSFTFAAWTKPASIPPGDDQITFNNILYGIINKAGYHDILYYHADTRFHMDVRATDGQTVSMPYAVSQPYPPGEWHHVVGVIDDSDKSITIYVDGRPEGSETYSGKNLVIQGATSLYVGALAPTGAWRSHFHGWIDEARVFNRALTAAEVAQLYQTRPNGSIGMYSDTDVVANADYRYSIKAFNNDSCGWSTGSGSDSDFTSLKGPTKLAATAVDTTTIILSWLDNTTTENVFFLQRCPGNNAACVNDSSFTTSFQLGANATSYTDSSVQYGSTHTYRIRAEKSTTPGWISEFTTAGSVSTPGIAPPSDFNVIRLSEETIRLDWLLNTIDEDGIEIQRCTGASCTGFTLITTLDNGADTFTDTLLTPDTTYRYRVRAVKNLTENSQWLTDWATLAVTGKDTATTTLYRPELTLVDSIDTTRIDLGWTDPTGHESSLILERCDMPASWEEKDYTPPSQWATNGTLKYTTVTNDTVAMNDSSGAGDIYWQNGHAVFHTTSTYTADTANDYNGVSIDSNFDVGALVGNKDFDLQVEFNLPEGTGSPVTYEVYLRMHMFFTNDSSGATDYFGDVERTVWYDGTAHHSISGGAWINSAWSSMGHYVPVDNNNGKMRLVRTNDTLTGYAWDQTNNQWLSLGSLTRLSPELSANRIHLRQDVQRTTLFETTTEFYNFKLTVGNDTILFADQADISTACNDSTVIPFAADTTSYSDTTSAICRNKTYYYRVQAVDNGLSNDRNRCWQQKKKLAIVNFLADYPMQIEVPFVSGMQSDFADIRFFDETDQREIPYWIERKTNGSKAFVWIMTRGNNDIYLYYNNPDAISSSDRSIAAHFSESKYYEFFDNFTGTTIDSSKWVELDSNSLISQNNQLQLATGTAWNAALISTRTFKRSPGKSLIAGVVPGDQTYNNTADYFMLGWESDQTASYNQTALVHGLYFANFIWDAYEKGTDKSYKYPRRYSPNYYYEVKVALDAASASYWVRYGGGNYDYGENWQEIETEKAYSDSPMRIAIHQKSHIAALNWIAVKNTPQIEPSYTFANDTAASCITGNTWTSAASDWIQISTAPADAPAPPQLTVLSESDIEVAWQSNSTDEDYFIVERCDGDANSCPAGNDTLFNTIATPAKANLLYHMNESLWNGTAGEVHDDGKYGLHGKANSATITTGGKDGNGGQFAAGKKITVADHERLRFYQNMTFSIEGWFKPDVDVKSMSSDWPYFVFKRPNQGGWGSHFSKSTGKINIQYRDSSTIVSAISTTVITAGKWYHYAGTMDGEYLRLYINGILEASTPATVTMTSSAGSDLFIGENFQGIIDEVAVYDYALSEEEIDAHYSRGIGLRHSDKGLVPGDSYTYRVRTYKSSGNCDYNLPSAPVTATTVAATPPGNVAAVIDPTQTTGRINLSWTDKTLANTHFIIERCTGADCTEFQELATVDGNILDYSDTDVCTGEVYNYRVKAANEEFSHVSTMSNNGSTGWSRRKPVTIPAFVAGNNIRITIAWDSDMQKDFSDIRFFDETAGVELPYWIESTLAGDTAIVWIKPGSNNTISMYYGNPNADSSSSGDDTFIFFDDFNDGFLATKWSQSADNGTAFTEANGELKVTKVAKQINIFSGALSNTLMPYAATARTRTVTAAATAGWSPVLLYYNYRTLANLVEYKSTITDSFKPLEEWHQNTIVAKNTTNMSRMVEFETAPSRNWSSNHGGQTLSEGGGLRLIVGGGNGTIYNSSTAEAGDFRLDWILVRKGDSLTPYGTVGNEEQGTLLWDTSYTSATQTNIAPGSPLAPVSLTGAGYSESEINITWTDSMTEEDGYLIERCADSGCSDFRTVANLSSNFEDTFDEGILPQYWKLSGRLQNYNVDHYEWVYDSTAPVDFSASSGSSKISWQEGKAVIHTVSKDIDVVENNYSRMELKDISMLGTNNFDIQVDYNLPNGYIEGNQGRIYARLIAHFGSDYVYVERTNTTNHYGRIQNNGAAVATTVYDNNTSGKLRVERLGNVLNAYSWINDKWKLIQTGTIDTGDAVSFVGIYQYAHMDDNYGTGGQNLTVELENFKLRVSPGIIQNFTSGIDSSFWDTSLSLQYSSSSTAAPNSITDDSGVAEVTWSNGKAILHTISNNTGNTSHNYSRITLKNSDYIGKNNFDIKVDYNLPNGPDVGNKYHVHARLYISLGSDGIFIERYGDNQFKSTINNNGSPISVWFTDGGSSGALRITRTGTEIKTYMWLNDQWHLLNSGTMDADDTVSAVGIIQYAERDENYGIGGQELITELDNFSLVVEPNILHTFDQLALPSGTVFYWAMNEASWSSGVTDSSGNNNNATVYGNAASTANGYTGRGGNLNQSGNADYIMVYPFANMPTSQISIGFWIKTTDTGSGIISYSSTASTNDFLLFNPTNIAIHRAAVAVNTGVSIADGAWHFIVVTWQGSNGLTKLYKDGVESYSGTLASGTAITTGGAFMLAQEQDALAGGLDVNQATTGIFDEVILFNRVLSLADVQSFYTSSYWHGEGIDNNFWKCLYNTSGSDVSGTCPTDISNASGSLATYSSNGKAVMHTVSNYTGENAYNYQRFMPVNIGFAGIHDFDIQVDYNLPQGPISGNQYRIYARLQVSFGSDYFWIERSNLNDTTSAIKNNGIETTQTVSNSINSGRLRLVRQDTVVSTYYWQNEAWQLLHTSSIDLNDKVSFIGISQYAHKNETYGSGGQDVMVELDNFSMTINNNTLMQFADTGGIMLEPENWNLMAQLGSGSSTLVPMQVADSSGSAAIAFDHGPKATLDVTSTGSGTSGSFNQTQVELASDSAIDPGKNDFDIQLDYTINSTQCLPPPSDGVLHWKMDEESWHGTSGEILDATGHGNNGTAVGAAQTTAGTVDGNIASLNQSGTGDYARLSSFSTMPTNNIAVSFWIQTTDVNAGIFSYASSTSDNEFLIFLLGNGTVRLYRRNLTVDTNVLINDGDLHHIVVTWQKSNGSTKLYKDGIEVYSGTLSTGVTMTAGGVLMLGQEQDSLGGGLDGGQALTAFMDEMQIFDHILTLQEVQRLISGLYSSKNSSDVPAVYLQMNENGWSGKADDVLDSSLRQNHGTSYNGLTTTSDASRGQVGEFDGNNDYIDLGNPLSLQITGDQTIAFWINPTDFAVRRNPYAKAYGGEGTITVETDGAVHYFYGTSGGNTEPYQALKMTSPLTAGEWTHLAIVRDLTNMKLSWYKNGIKVNEATASYAQATRSSLPALVGQGYTNNFYGGLDDLMVYGHALSAQEIKNLYLGLPVVTGKELCNSTPQSFPSFERCISLPDTMHFKMDEMSWTGAADEVVDSSGNHNHGVAMNDTITVNDATRGRVGNFDGIGHYVRTDYKIPQNNSSSTITMAAWVYPTSTSAGRHHVISTDDGGFDWSILREGSKWFAFTGNSSTDSGFTVDLNTWQHIAAVFHNGTAVFYKNGVPSASMTADYDYSANPVAIGKNPGYPEYFAGKIDDVRLYRQALNAADIQNIYTASQDQICNSLALWLPMDEDNWYGASRQVTDYADSFHHGTAEGNAGVYNDFMQRGKVGVFSNNDSSVTVFDVEELENSSEITYSLWFRRSADNPTASPYGINNVLISRAARNPTPPAELELFAGYGGILDNESIYMNTQYGEIEAFWQNGRGVFHTTVAVENDSIVTHSVTANLTNYDLSAVVGNNDFDVEVSYNFPEGIELNGFHTTPFTISTLFTNDSSGIQYEIYLARSMKWWCSDLIVGGSYLGGSWEWLSKSDYVDHGRGKFRITRINEIISYYYWNNEADQWTLLAVSAKPLTPEMKLTKLKFNQWGNSDNSNTYEYITEYYDFKLTSGNNTITLEPDYNSNFELGTQGNNIEFYLKTNDSPVYGSVTEAIVDDNWYHLTFTYDAQEPNETKLYINGVLKGEWSDGGGLLPGLGISPVTLGNTMPGTGAFGSFTGMIDDVRIYKQALSQAEIKQIYADSNRDTQTVNAPAGVKIGFDTGDYITLERTGQAIDGFWRTEENIDGVAEFQNLKTAAESGKLRILRTAGDVLDPQYWRQYGHLGPSGTPTVPIDIADTNGSVNIDFNDSSARFRFHTVSRQAHAVGQWSFSEVNLLNSTTLVGDDAFEIQADYSLPQGPTAHVKKVYYFRMQLVFTGGVNFMMERVNDFTDCINDWSGYLTAFPNSTGNEISTAAHAGRFKFTRVKNSTNDTISGAIWNVDQWQPTCSLTINSTDTLNGFYIQSFADKEDAQDVLIEFSDFSLTTTAANRTIDFGPDYILDKLIALIWDGSAWVELPTFAAGIPADTEVSSVEFYNKVSRNSSISSSSVISNPVLTIGNDSLPQWMENTLISGGDYTYRVTPYTVDDNCSSWSSYYTTTSSTTEVVAPSGLTLTSKNTTEAHLTWVDPANTETAFEIDRCTGSSCDFSTKSTFTTGPNINSYADLTLAHSTAYRYRVRALNSNVPWQSGYSNIITVTTNSPVAPTSLTVAWISEIELRLQWVDNSADETSFLVERCTIPLGDETCSDFAQVQSLPAGTISYNDKNGGAGLPYQRKYRYQVRAYKDAAANDWWSTYTNSASGETAVDIGALTATTIDSTNIYLSWIDKSASETHFAIQRCNGTTCNENDFVTIPGLEVAANTTSITDSTVCAALSYSYRVIPIHKVAGTDDWNAVPSNTATASTGGLWEPKPPYALKAYSLYNELTDDNTIAVSWVYDTLDEQGFRLERCTGSDCTDFDLIPVNFQPVQSDNFDSGISNMSYWRPSVKRTNGSSITNILPISFTDSYGGASVSATSGKIEMITTTKDNSSQYIGYYTATIELVSPDALLGPSDFDVQIDFSNVQYPASWYAETNPIRIVHFEIRFPDYEPTDSMIEGDYLYIELLRSSNTAGRYSAGSRVNAIATTATAVNFTGTAGKLRLQKANGKLSAYYHNGTGWSLLHAPVQSMNYPDLAPVSLAISNENYYAASKSTSSVRIDNFQINTSSFSYLDANLDELTEYRYQVHAFKDIPPPGCPWDERYSDIQNQVSRPNKPTTLEAVIVPGTDLVKLTWDDNAPNAEGYEIEKLLWNGFWMKAHTTTNRNFFFTGVGTDPGKPYSYRVRAFYGSLKSAYSNAATVTLPTFQPENSSCPPAE